MTENIIQDTSMETVKIDLREFLKEGNKIRTKFITGSEWIINTITLVEEDTFEMHLKVAYVVNNISKGDAMTFKYTYDKYEYVMNGTVDEINLYENLITINIYNIQQFSNKRKDMRFDVSLCSYIIYDYMQKPTYALIQNISKGGISLETKADLSVGSTFGLNLFLSKDKIISLVGKILRKKTNPSNFIYDAQVDSINRNSIALFEELFSVLEKFDDELLYNYISSLNKT